MRIIIRKIRSICRIGENKAIMLGWSKDNIRFRVTLVCPHSCCEIQAVPEIIDNCLKVTLISKNTRSRRLCLQCISTIEFELTIFDPPSVLKDVEIFYNGQKLLHYKR